VAGRSIGVAGRFIGTAGRFIGVAGLSIGVAGPFIGMAGLFIGVAGLAIGAGAEERGRLFFKVRADLGRDLHQQPCASRVKAAARKRFRRLSSEKKFFTDQQRQEWPSRAGLTNA
jgi:hypothetical protein